MGKEINITSSVIEKGIELVRDFLEKAIGPSIEEAGLLISDQVRLWRFKNQISMLENAQNYIEKKDIEIQEIPIKILVPLLEKSSLEENEDLKEKWVGLLVNYVDSRKKYRSAIFPNILSQLSSNEAKCLEFMNGQEIIKYEDIPDDLDIYEAELSNLIRLGLVRKMPPRINMTKLDLTWDGRVTNPNLNYDKSDLKYRVTELGFEFLLACKLEE